MKINNYTFYLFPTKPRHTGTIFYLYIMKKMHGFSFFLYLSLSLFYGCASVTSEGVSSIQQTGSSIPAYPDFSGEAVRVQVMQFRIPPELAQKYPEFTEKQVGFGLSGRIVDELYNTRRFVFIEEKAEMQQKILEQWAMSQSGIVVENEEISTDGLSAPQFLVYAELTDFSVSYSEKINGITMEKQATTIMSLQLRLLDVATGEYIPATGSGSATSSAKGVWVSSETPFDQSTVGTAAQRATQAAVLQLINRMKWPDKNQE